VVMTSEISDFDSNLDGNRESGPPLAVLATGLTTSQTSDIDSDQENQPPLIGVDSILATSQTASPDTNQENIPPQETRAAHRAPRLHATFLGQERHGGDALGLEGEDSEYDPGGGLA
jgi:hypothetical protein